MHTKRIAAVLILAAAVAGCAGENQTGAVTGENLQSNVSSSSSSQEEIGAKRARMRGMLTATWQSATDDDLRYGFEADGDFAETHEGAAAQNKTGTWTAFTADMELDPSVTFQLNNADVYVTIATGDDTAHYRVSKLTINKLELVAMSGTGTLMFTKVEQNASSR